MIYKYVKFKGFITKQYFIKLLIIIVVAGFSAIALTAPGDNSSSSQKSSELSYFDPFNLETIYLSTAENAMNTAVSGNPVVIPSIYAAVNSTNVSLEDSLLTRPPIRVPYRPPLRSPFRPPWVPGPPSWYPGNPPWAP